MTTQSDGGPVLMTVDEVAASLRISPWTLYRWNTLGVGPDRVRVGRRVLYRAADVERWLAERRAS
jgi:excisionase family DNA binding protein